jgi:hypothetical protein
LVMPYSSTLCLNAKTTMKKKFLIILGIALLVLIAAFTYLLYVTQKNSPQDMAVYRIREGEVKVTYSRPYKKDRLLFGDESSGALQPYGKYWRMGANEATVFVTNKDLMVNGEHLKAGNYSLHAYPGKDNWQIVFNSEFKRWGGKAPDAAKDVLKTQVPVNNNAPEQEQFTISFESVDSSSHYINMVLWWDQTEVKIPIMIHD